MTEFISPHDFAAKIEWEGGVIDALEYGLTHNLLDPDDDDSMDLRSAWQDLEARWQLFNTDLEDVNNILANLEETEDDD